MIDFGGRLLGETPYASQWIFNTHRLAVTNNFTHSRCGNFSILGSDHVVNNGKKVLFFQYQFSCFYDVRQTIFIFVVCNMAFDDITRLFIVVDIDGNEALFREILMGIGSPVIKRQGIAKKGIGKFFGKMVCVNVIFYDNMILKGIERLSFVYHGFDTMTKNFKLFQIFF